MKEIIFTFFFRFFSFIVALKIVLENHFVCYTIKSFFYSWIHQDYSDLKGKHSRKKFECSFFLFGCVVMQVLCTHWIFSFSISSRDALKLQQLIRRNETKRRRTKLKKTKKIAFTHTEAVERKTNRLMWMRTGNSNKREKEFSVSRNFRCFVFRQRFFSNKIWYNRYEFYLFSCDIEQIFDHRWYVFLVFNFKSLISIFLFLFLWLESKTQNENNFRNYQESLIKSLFTFRNNWC